MMMVVVVVVVVVVMVMMMMMTEGTRKADLLAVDEALKARDFLAALGSL